MIDVISSFPVNSTPYSIIPQLGLIVELAAKHPFEKPSRFLAIIFGMTRDRKVLWVEWILQ